MDFDIEAMFKRDFPNAPIDHVRSAEFVEMLKEADTILMSQGTEGIDEAMAKLSAFMDEDMVRVEK